MTFGSFLFCSYEYEREKSCLKTHVATCLSVHVDLVTSLLLHLLYHCGDLTYQPSIANTVMLGKIKCKDEAFMDTEFCWEYFRDKLNSNRSDPSLCRWDLGWLRWCHCIFFFALRFHITQIGKPWFLCRVVFQIPPPPLKKWGKKEKSFRRGRVFACISLSSKPATFFYDKTLVTYF